MLRWGIARAASPTEAVRRPSTRVLLVGDASSPHVQRLAVTLASTNVDVAVASFERGDLPVSEIRLGKLPASADLRYLLAIPRLRQVIRRSRPHIVHAHYLSGYGLMAAVACIATKKQRRPRLVQSVWGTDILVTANSLLRRRLASFALRSADAVTGDSTELEIETKRIAPGVRWHRFVFGPPAQLLVRRSPRQEIIVSSRNLVPAMRVADILDAFAMAQASPTLAAYRLVVCGRGPELSRLASRMAHPRIDYRGSLPQSELHELLLTSRVFVSIPETDGTSASLLEAMAAGNIPIVNRLPANVEWVRPEIGEVVSRDPSIEELAAAIVSAATRTVESEEIRSAVAGATWESEFASLLGLYELLRPEEELGRRATAAERTKTPRDP